MSRNKEIGRCAQQYIDAVVSSGVQRGLVQASEADALKTGFYIDPFAWAAICLSAQNVAEPLPAAVAKSAPAGRTRSEEKAPPARPTPKKTARSSDLINPHGGNSSRGI